MREIVNIQIGQCGNSIGSEFWKMACDDHGLSEKDGVFNFQPDIRLARINVLFNEFKGLRYSPRSIMIDLDKSSLEAVRSASNGKIFKPDNFLFGAEGTGNNWAKGHFSEGAELCEKSLDKIRREVEGCDCFYGFQILHSIGGGTGGGLGSLLLNHLKEEYPMSILTCYSVIPSPKTSNTVVEPYNAVLTLNHLIECTHETFCIDNEALFYITSEVMKISQANMPDLNYLIALVITGVTSSFRFPGPATSSMRKITVNLIPYPRLHFLVPSFAPITYNRASHYLRFTVADIANQVFNYRNLFAACDAHRGKFMTASCLFRGEIPMREIDQQMSLIQNRDSAMFVEWIPDNIKTSCCTVPFPGNSRSATFIGNTTAIKTVFKRIIDQYLIMFKRKVYLHWYTAEGLEEIEFHQSEAHLNDLIQLYREYEEAKFEKPDPFPC